MWYRFLTDGLVKEPVRCFYWSKRALKKEITQVRDLGTLISKQDVSIKSLPSVLREPCRRGGKKWCMSQEGWTDTKNTWPYISRIKTHMNSQSLRQHAEGLHGTTTGPWHIYTISLVFLWDP